MSYLTSRAFWLATVERAVKTFAQTFLAALTIGQTAGSLGLDIRTIDWTTSLSLAVGATLLSVLTSLGSGTIGERNTPSALAAKGSRN